MNQTRKPKGFLASEDGLEKLQAKKREKRYKYEDIRKEAKVTLDQVKRLFNPHWGYKIGVEAIELIADVLDLRPEEIVDSDLWHSSPNAADLEIKQIHWQEICRNMLEKHKRLTTNQFFFADEDKKFELEEIHVPLALVQRSKPKKCNPDNKPEQGSQLYEPSYEQKQRFEHQAFLEKIIRNGVGKTQGHRIALIGEPGAGKTTQLQTIAFWILNNNLGLPIWISLADLQTKSVENYLLQDWLKNALEVVRVTEEQENALADLFKNNCVWLLLDAADEMS